MKMGYATLSIGLMGALLLVSGATQAGDFRFSLGTTLASGWIDVADYNSDYHSSESIRPIPLTIRPRYDFSNRIGIGLDVGPVILDASFSDVPVMPYVRYSFILKRDLSIFLKAGFSRHAASGDDVEGTSTGFFGAAGMDFPGTRRVGMGIELGYDSGIVTFKTLEHDWNGDTWAFHDVRPGGFMFSFFLTF